ncbi:acyl-CoA Delta-9 desaturase-like [Neocloeon triangulifer]|uniref:acyl-CoA Delta-9 desaturase-like n=1 Tax=Neocloeon triangulifer TaxID=2078957 RepID=UPI00286ED6A8|nr:acyl-CoA Delta-9 desaturase-like [Neocloeon triangulifer]
MTSIEDLQKLCNKVESVIASLGPDTITPRPATEPDGPTGVLYEDEDQDMVSALNIKISNEANAVPSKSVVTKTPYRLKIRWRNVFLLSYLHLAALYGLYLLCTSAKFITMIYTFLLYQAGGLGITAGAHRLWAHRGYKAKWPLKIILMIFNTLAFQNHIYEWVRDHRVHHKYSETDADPHNAKRGFFFSHIGWLLCRKHPMVIEKGSGISLKDLEEDKIVMFQKKYYLYLMPFICFIVPTVVPVFIWNESWSTAWFGATLFRYTFTLNVTWMVNSFAHMWGNKPYDTSINPAENYSVAVLALGEGWHNYHHVFPWDYKTAELGNYRMNITTAFIDFFGKIGWAYDMKTVPKDVVMKRAIRTGDGTHLLWGWGDKDMTEEHRKATTELNSKDK